MANFARKRRTAPRKENGLNTLDTMMCRVKTFDQEGTWRAVYGATASVESGHHWDARRRSPEAPVAPPPYTVVGRARSAQAILYACRCRRSRLGTARKCGRNLRWSTSGV